MCVWCGASQILLRGKINSRDFDKEWTKGRGHWSITEDVGDDDRDAELEDESSSERDSEREGTDQELPMVWDQKAMGWVDDMVVHGSDSGERSRRKNKKGGSNSTKKKKDIKADEEEEFMLVQSGTARNAMEIIVGNPEWSDYIIEADLRNVGGRYRTHAHPSLRPSLCLTMGGGGGLVRSWGHPGVIFHAQDVNNYEVIYFRPHSFHSGITPASRLLSVVGIPCSLRVSFPFSTLTCMARAVS